MEARAGIAIALLLVGCTQPQISGETSEPIVAVSPAVAPQQRSNPRRLKLRLTLDRPEDLKVKVGDWVMKGQVISDRSSVRANLLQEREVLRQQLKQLSIQTITPSYAVEQAEVEQARSQVDQARDAIANFHADSPWTDYARQVLPVAESTQIGELEAQYQEAKGKLRVALAKLHKAKQQKTTKPNPPTQQVELLRQIRRTEEQLVSLGVVKSPYSGLIKSVKWLEQTDQDLRAELTLTMESSPNAVGR